METKKIEMENLRNEVAEMLLDVIILCEEYEIDYCFGTLAYIGFDGAGSFAFYQDIEYDDLPQDLANLSDRILDKVLDEFCSSSHDIHTQFMEEVVDSIM